MSKCQYVGMPCFNHAEWRVTVKYTSFGKRVSHHDTIYKICDDCYNVLNPKHKNHFSVSHTKEELEEHIKLRHGDCNCHAHPPLEMDVDKWEAEGFTYEQIFTFRRLR